MNITTSLSTNIELHNGLSTKDSFIRYNKYPINFMAMSPVSQEQININKLNATKTSILKNDMYKMPNQSVSNTIAKEVRENSEYRE